MAKLLDTLHSEHEMVKSVFQQIQSSSSGPEKDRLFSKLRHELMPHMRGEEKYFYPVLQQDREAKEDALEAVEEHHAAKVFLNELEDMSAGDEHWDAKISVLKEMIEHHIEEEEGKIFSKARKLIPEDRMAKIAEQFESEKARV